MASARSSARSAIAGRLRSPGQIRVASSIAKAKNARNVATMPETAAAFSMSAVADQTAVAAHMTSRRPSANFSAAPRCCAVAMSLSLRVRHLVGGQQRYVAAQPDGQYADGSIAVAVRLAAEV